MTDMTSGTTQTRPAGGSDAQGTGSMVRDEAGSVVNDAKQAGGRVADTAKEGVARVADETRSQARRLANEATAELRVQAEEQQRRVAQGLRSTGDELRRMADASTEPGVATELVQEAAWRTSSIAQWLDDRDPDSLLQEVKQFARRRPGVFIAVAIGAGVLAGRLTRALTDSSGGGGGSHVAGAPTLGDTRTGPR